MKMELNYREYIYAPYPKNIIKCSICAWKSLPTYYCAKFCRTGLIFRTTGIAPSVFHL